MAAGVIRARAVPMPTNSVLVPLYVGADLLDAFAIRLPAAVEGDIETLAGAAFERPAGWIQLLTQVRDLAMATAGVKSSHAIGIDAAARGSVIVQGTRTTISISTRMSGEYSDWTPIVVMLGIPSPFSSSRAIWTC
jgi:hypothetical protein